MKNRPTIRMRRGIPRCRATVLLPLLLLLSSCGAWAQTPAGAVTRGEVVGQPWTGTPGITEPVQALMARSDNNPGRTRLYADRFPRSRRAKRKHLRRFGEAGTGPAGGGRDMRVLDGRTDTRRAPQTVTSNFLGATYLDTPGFTPPDAMGAAGPTQFVVCINGRIRSFDKATGLPDGALDLNTDVFFSSVDTGVGTSDPRVRFDPLSDRWFIIAINVPLYNNRIMLAVSDGPVISARSSFTFFQFQQNLPTPSGNLNQFADYPSLGVDAHALYIGANMFGSDGYYKGTSAWVIRKSSVLGSGPLVVTAFRNLATSTATINNPGPYTPHGVDNNDPNPTYGYFIGVDNAEFGKLVVRRVSDPGGTPAISPNMVVDVPPTTYPTPVTPLGSTCPVDTLDDRLLAAQMHRNVLTGETTLWTSHTIETSITGTAAAGGGRIATRWYELKNMDTAPALRQSGTLYDNAVSGPRHYFNATVAMSGQGHMALGCSYASGTEYLGIAVAGRLASDPLGTLRPPTLALSSLYAYNFERCGFGTSYQRWGDYSYVCVDPDDNMTMWTVQEYTHAPDTWGVRVLRLQAPPPATPTGVSTGTLTPGMASVPIVVTGASTDGSGFFDPGPPYPNRLTATVSGTGVTVNSVTFTSPTQITLSVSVAAGAAPGPRTLTVTNPDGQSVSVAGLLAVAGTPFGPADAAAALRIAGGLANPTPQEAARLNVVASGASATVVDIQDALRIARTVAGLE